MIVKVSKVVARLRNALSIFVSSAGECFIFFGEELGGFLALVLTCIFLLPILGVIVLLNLLYSLLERAYKRRRNNEC